MFISAFRVSVIVPFLCKALDLLWNTSVVLFVSQTTTRVLQRTPFFILLPSLYGSRERTIWICITTIRKDPGGKRSNCIENSYWRRGNKKWAHLTKTTISYFTKCWSWLLGYANRLSHTTYIITRKLEDLKFFLMAPERIWNTYWSMTPQWKVPQGWF